MPNFLPCLRVLPTFDNQNEEQVLHNNKRGRLMIWKEVFLLSPEGGEEQQQRNYTMCKSSRHIVTIYCFLIKDVSLAFHGMRNCCKWSGTRGGKVTAVFSSIAPSHATTPYDRFRSPICWASLHPLPIHVVVCLASRLCFELSYHCWSEGKTFAMTHAQMRCLITV